MLQLKAIHKDTYNLLKELSAINDLDSLLSLFSLSELLSFFEMKYQKMNSFTVMKSLAYFEDADQEPDPISLLTLTWEEIKEDLKLELRNSS